MSVYNASVAILGGVYPHLAVVHSFGGTTWGLNRVFELYDEHGVAVTGVITGVTALTSTFVVSVDTGDGQGMLYEYPSSPLTGTPCVCDPAVPLPNSHVTSVACPDNVCLNNGDQRSMDLIR